MNTLAKISSTILLLGFSVPSFSFAIPDLFGAYQQGAEAARQANARDAYYYAQMNQPQFYFEIWGNNKKKRNLNLSLKKYDNVCWGIYNLPYPDGTVLYASELFTMPYNGEFTGASPNKTLQKITASKQVQPNAVGFDKQILVKNGEAGSCWTITLPIVKTKKLTKIR